MKKKPLHYIFLFLLLLAALAAVVPHSLRAVKGVKRFIVPSQSVRVPFDMTRATVGKFRLPEGEAAGFQPGDQVIRVNGRELLDEYAWQDEFYKLKVGDRITFRVARPVKGAAPEQLDLSFTGVGIEMSWSERLSRIPVPLFFTLLLPIVAYFLGFYVAFVRPRDPQAWLLLMVLLCIGSIPMEGSQRSGGYIYFFQQTLINSLGIWMLLFAVYFPERWKIDKKYPWAKWVLLIPLVVSATLNLVEQVGRLFAWPWLWRTVNNLTEPYDKPQTILSMVATGLFFSILAIKSRTVENNDSRRRLSILYVGTSLAMLPALIIVSIRIVRGVTGGFFDLVPAWFAIFALVSLLLFPLTMAYVIVVQRAMDVRVVIRQGVQYALASNSVKALQLIFLTAVILAVIWTFRNFNENFLVQVGFAAAGIALIPLIAFGAKRLKTAIDKKFFREAYDSELILTELSEDVRTIFETRPLLETVSSKISESLHVPQVALLLKNQGAFQSAYALGYDSNLTVGFGDDDSTVEKLRKNQPVVIYQDAEEAFDDEGPKEIEALRQLNTQLLLPIAAKNELTGIISLSPKRSEQPYSPNDLRLLKSVAAQTGLALENSRLTEAIARETGQRERLNRELEIAREVQERLFPQEFPHVEGLEYYGACRPALGVGGDYYDFIELEDGKFGIAIGDVSGKGIGASLMMASLQASLRGQAIHSKDDLAGLMKRVNKLVYETSTTNRYATFFHAQYDPQTRRLIYVNAGHNPPYLLRGNGDDIEVMQLKEGGAVVGMLPPMLVNYTQGEVELLPGDLLAGFTDGISEAMNPEEEEWGEEAMVQELKKIKGRSCKEILDHIVAAADGFANGAKQHDDMTMIVLQAV